MGRTQTPVLSLLLVLAGSAVSATGIKGPSSITSPWFHPDHKAAEDALIARALAHPEAEFYAWMQQYNHRFSPEEEQRVFASWKEAVHRMAEHNAQPDITWFMGIAERTGMGYATGHKPASSEQQQQQETERPKLARRLAQHATGYIPLSGQHLPGSNNSNPVDLYNNLCPDKLDWRALNLVSSVKNQGRCGSCWTFSITGALESAWGQVQSLDGRVNTGDNNDVEFSQQFALDCLENQAACNGGNTFLAYSQLAGEGWQLPLASDYPYTSFWVEEDSYGANLTKKCQRPIARAAEVSVGDVYSVAHLTDELLQKLVCHQPVSVAVNATGIIESYRGGVIPPGTLCDADGTNHAVLVVGYTPDYWIVKNSWGWQYGEGGYFRLSRNTTNPKGVCNILDEGAAIPILKSKEILPPPAFDPFFMRTTPLSANDTAAETSTTATETSDVAMNENSNTGIDGSSLDGNLPCKGWLKTSATDTFASISKDTGVSVRDLIDANKLDPTAIPADTPLGADNFIVIPCSAAPSVTSKVVQCRHSVTVEPNDTVNNIVLKIIVELQKSTQLNISDTVVQDRLLNALFHWNPQFNNAYPVAGDVIYIPQCHLTSKDRPLGPDPRCVKVGYTIQLQDTLYKIANMFSCTIADLLSLNPQLVNGIARHPDIFLDAFAGSNITVHRCPPSSRSWSLTPISEYDQEFTQCQSYALVTDGQDVLEVAQYFNVSISELSNHPLNILLNFPAVIAIPPCELVNTTHDAPETSTGAATFETSSAASETSSASETSTTKP